MAMTSHTQSERSYLRDRISMAHSASEARYYEEKLHRLESEMMRMNYEHLRIMPMPMPMPTSLGVDLAKEEATPLSFLKNADKKLLLTGATP